MTINTRCILDILLQGGPLENATIRGCRAHECASQNAALFKLSQVAEKTISAPTNTQIESASP